MPEFRSRARLTSLSRPEALGSNEESLLGLILAVVTAPFFALVGLKDLDLKGDHPFGTHIQ